MISHISNSDMVKEVEARIKGLLKEGRVYFHYGQKFGMIKDVLSDDLRNQVLVQFNDSEVRFKTITYWISWDNFEYDILCCRGESVIEQLFTRDEMVNELERQFTAKIRDLDSLQ